MACYSGLWGILSGHPKSTDHPSISGRKSDVLQTSFIGVDG